jgi:hypothetical protein
VLYTGAKGGTVRKTKGRKEGAKGEQGTFDDRGEAPEQRGRRGVIRGQIRRGKIWRTGRKRRGGGRRGGQGAKSSSRWGEAGGEPGVTGGRCTLAPRGVGRGGNREPPRPSPSSS